MTNNSIYIKAATQISMQQPLAEHWMDSPVESHEPYVRSIDPDFRQWLSPLESRRMGKILKRALVTAQQAMTIAGIAQPDAVITGTGLGCIETTEQFLYQLCHEGEQMLKPTHFMQSTHNTISSLIAIHHHLHGYNTTYSHRSLSFDTALLDAFMQLRLGSIRNALVTGNDEMTPTYYRLLQRTGYVGQPGQVPAGEASVAMLLTTDPAEALCEVEGVKMHYGSFLQPPVRDVDLLVVGTNGAPRNDEFYRRVAALLPGVPCFSYKHLFGECYAASALGLYASAHLVACGKARRLLFVNHSDGHNMSFVTLKKA